MYSQDAIDALITRIGWSDISSDLPFDLSDENETSDSGKTFSFYHYLVLVDNIYASVPDPEMDEEDFNLFLSDIRKQAVLNVLTSIFDQHVDYVLTQDYSSVIEQRSNIFDDVIGYTVAIKMIELFISTTRSNFSERNAKMSYQSLKVELEGAKNENGHFIAKGIVYKLEKSIRKAREIIFPILPIVTSKSVW
ncbi:hypothetical protein [Flavobacterium sp. CF136]|uniref:hypothetical protein n=1 Tax=Flavobacterium sp. (strain CF136) TaxID=1144313 RepID=UPI0002719F15|nr:hypothetical protein [Flavobacterium sp. CF136]EJL66307.1 hypothetical protein PMI10_00655 [Flavobacterium sp. CF136]